MSAIEIHSLSDGRFLLDGGAMFGVVPRVLWERQHAADELNRILLGLNCLLLQGAGFTALIDTGVGDKEDARFAERFGLMRQATLFDALAAAGLEPGDITHVINTHLHFDHCGGNTRRDESGQVRPSFPNARYIVQRGEWQDACQPHERSRASYFSRNFLPVQESGQLDLVEGEMEILPGIHLLPTPGHTAHHMSLLIDLGPRRLFHPADLMPIHSHLPLPYIMSYDLYPMETLATKRRILARLREENWLIYFPHEAGADHCGEVAWVPTKKGEQPVFRPLPLAEIGAAPA
jgi:glyoxylase-like metal-dependent hydrolase (beta-lactamase superfamily II)